jgi:ATP-dependent helicase YprA (DUF1998 family)
VPAVFLYDRYPGGLGFVEKASTMVPRLLEASLELVEGCDCGDGCPVCVGMPTILPAQHQDPDAMGGWPIPSKGGALWLLRRVLEKGGDWTPPPAPTEDVLVGSTTDDPLGPGPETAEPEPAGWEH